MRDSDPVLTWATQRDDLMAVLALEHFLRGLSQHLRSPNPYRGFYCGAWYYNGTTGTVCLYDVATQQGLHSAAVDWDAYSAALRDCASCHDRLNALTWLPCSQLRSIDAVDCALNAVTTARRWYTLFVDVPDVAEPAPESLGPPRLRLGAPHATT
jgi:hypothetical protein